MSEKMNGKAPRPKDSRRRVGTDCCLRRGGRIDLVYPREKFFGTRFKLTANFWHVAGIALEVAPDALPSLDRSMRVGPTKFNETRSS